jgi:hypothetical protein
MEGCRSGLRAEVLETAAAAVLGGCGGMFLGDLDNDGRPGDLEVPGDLDGGRLAEDVIFGVFKSLFMSFCGGADGELLPLDLVGVWSRVPLLFELPALSRLPELSLLEVDFGLGGDRIGDSTTTTESTTVSSSSGSETMAGLTVSFSPSSSSDTSSSVQSDSSSVCCCFIVLYIYLYVCIYSG